MPYFHYGKKSEPGTIFKTVSENVQEPVATQKRTSFCDSEIRNEPILPPKARRLTVTSLLTVPQKDNSIVPFEMKRIEVNYEDDAVAKFKEKLTKKRESGISQKISECNYNVNSARCCSNVSLL